MESVEALAPTKNKQVGCEGNFYGYLPTTLVKIAKKPCNKLFTSTLERLVGQRRLVQIYLPGCGEQNLDASTLEDGIGKKARRGGVCVRGKRSPREILFVFTSSCRYDLIDV